MDDAITQMRLSIRLDNYLRDYTGKNVSQEHLHRQEWNSAWKAADVARIASTLTPQLVDDVRIVLQKM
jgi:hypothetical protein